MQVVHRKSEENGWLAAMGGPQQWRPADAERVIAACNASGLSLAAFAEKHGISAQRIVWWRRKLGCGAPQTPERVAAAIEAASAMEFVPVTVREERPREPMRGAVTLAMPGGVRIEVTDPACVSPAWLAALASQLAGGAA